MILVAADVKVLTRGQRGDFPDDVGDERVGDVLVDAERAESNVDARVQGGASPLQFNSGYEASAALVWLGMSISGTIVMNRSRAYFTRSAYWACV